MGLIGSLVTFAAGTRIKSAEVNTNLSTIKTAVNNTGMFTDVARTVTAAITFAAGAMLFAAAGDIGSVAAPARHGYLSGVLVMGGATIVSAGNGDIVLKNTTGTLRGENAAFNSSLRLLDIDDANNLHIYHQTGAAAIGIGLSAGITNLVGTYGAAAGEVVISNNKSLRSLNAAAAGTRALIKLNASDKIEIGSASDVLLVPTAGAGIVLIGTTVSTGAAGGDVILAVNHYLRSVDVAGTGTRQLIGLGGGANQVVIGGDPSIVGIGSPPTFTSAAVGDLVLANNKSIRAVNSGSTDTLRVIQLGTSNQIAIGVGAVGPITCGDPVSIAGAAAGEVVVATNKAFRSSNAAGTSTYGLIYLDASDRVIIAGNVLVVGVGAPGSFTSAAVGEVVLANAKALRAANAAGTNTFPLIVLDATNFVQVGSTTHTNPIRIAYDTAANLLPGGGNGALGIDSTNNRFVYYSGGNRYFLAGTAF